VHADLEFEGQTFKDIAVRYKGNGTFLESRDSLKHSLKVDLSGFVKEQKLAGITKLNFHNSVTDASWMNEVLSYRLYRDAGIPAPQTAYARVFLTVPGKFDRQYFGLYSLVEDVDSNFAVQQFKAKHGAIFKPVTPSFFSDLERIGRSINKPTIRRRSSLTSRNSGSLSFAVWSVRLMIKNSPPRLVISSTCRNLRGSWPSWCSCPIWTAFWARDKTLPVFAS